MRKSLRTFVFFSSVLLFVLLSLTLLAQKKADIDVVYFKKKELTSGFVFDMNREREQLLTDETRYEETRNVYNGKYKLESRFWNLLDHKHEQFLSSFEIGVFGGHGDWTDSTYIQEMIADQSFYGLRTTGKLGYLSRFYYDPKNYTLVDIGAWGEYDLYKQNSEGTVIDSFGMASDFQTSETESRFRWGIRAKAGWGFGRLNPVNHLMTAEYLLRKYYPGRNFSDYEIAQFASVIASVKHSRAVKTPLNHEKEMAMVTNFVRNKLMLAPPEAMQADWQYSEFDPRYNGQRFEIGPYFQYYNFEPDFIWGFYALYENSKYKNVKWNRNISAALRYNSYKTEDWITAEINLGWSYFMELKNQFDFGLRYIPGYEISNSESDGGISNNVVPYLSYFTQLNARSRVKMNFAWRFSDGDNFVLPGPEFSLAIYRSKY